MTIQNLISTVNDLSSAVSLGAFNIVQGAVEIGDGSVLGSQCNIQGNVKIGKNCKIGNSVEIIGNVVIGDGCHLYSGVKIGLDPQHKKKMSAGVRKILIGNNNTFRENSTVHLPFHGEVTSVGSDNYVMVNVNIPHDAKIGDHIVICNNVALGGGVAVGDFANLGLNSVVHQSVCIGSYAMIGMGAVVEKNVLPFTMLTGNRVCNISINMVGFNRSYKGDIKMKDILHALSASKPDLSRAELADEYTQLVRIMEYDTTKGFYKI